MINYEVALGQFELFVLILIRLASFVYAAPFFNTANVPRKFKVGFAIALSVIVYAIHPDMSVEYDNMIDYCIIALQDSRSNTWCGEFFLCSDYTVLR